MSKHNNKNSSNDSRKARNAADSSKGSKRSPIVGEVDTTLNAFSFNVEQAQKDAKKVYAALQSQHEDYLRVTSRTTNSAYTAMYNNLREKHKKYLKDILHAETLTYKKISELYGESLTLEISHDVPEKKPKEDPIEDKEKEKEKKDSGRESQNKSSSVVSTILKLLGDIVNVYLKDFKNGWNQYLDAYVKNYNKFTTSFNTNASGLSNIISSSTSILDSRIGTGYYNITKDLLPALEKVASTGLLGDHAIAKATDDVISSKVMPYLNTSSEAWTNIYANYSQDTIKTLKGQQLQLKQTEAGSRLLESGVINSLTEEVEPLLRDVEYNTGSAKNLGEYEARMWELVNAGFTEREAYQFVKENYVDTAKNLYGALTSGNVTKTLIAADIVNGGTGRAGEQKSANVVRNADSDLGVSALTNHGITIPGSASTTANADNYLKSLSNTTEISTENAAEFHDESLSRITEVTHATDVTTNTIENAAAKSAMLVQNMDQHLVEVGEKIIGWLKSILVATIANAASNFIKGRGTVGRGAPVGGTGGGGGTTVSTPLLTTGTAGTVGGGTAGTAGTVGSTPLLTTGTTATTTGSTVVTTTSGTVGSTAGATGGTTAATTGTAGTVGAGSVALTGGAIAGAAIGAASIGSGIYDIATASGPNKKEQQKEGGIKIGAAAGGAALGAAIGSIIPGVGTLIGAGLGAGIGGLVGLIFGDDMSGMAKIEEAKESMSNLADASAKLSENLTRQQQIQQQLDSASGNLTATEQARLEVELQLLEAEEKALATKARAATTELVKNIDGFTKTLSNADIGQYSDEERAEMMDNVVDEETGETEWDQVSAQYESSIASITDALDVATLEGAQHKDKTNAKELVMAAKSLGSSYIDKAISGSVIEAEDKAQFDFSGDKKVGSYAKGLDYVPYDNFPAYLHKGETVLTAADSNLLRNLQKTRSEVTPATATPVVDTNSLISSIQSMITSVIDAIYAASDRIAGADQARLKKEKEIASAYNEEMISMVRTYMGGQGRF